MLILLSWSTVMYTELAGTIIDFLGRWTLRLWTLDLIRAKIKSPPYIFKLFAPILTGQFALPPKIPQPSGCVAQPEGFSFSRNDVK